MYIGNYAKGLTESEPFLFCGNSERIDMTAADIDFVKNCIRENRVHVFYTWEKWKKKRREILEKDHYECQECKKHGKYRRAVLVHHVKHLRDYPELALCDTYLGEDGKEHRQLISVCKQCHETVGHPERMTKQPQKEKFKNAERWD